MSFDLRLVELISSDLKDGDNVLFLGLSQEEAEQMSSHMKYSFTCLADPNTLIKDLDVLERGSFDAVVVVNILYRLASVNALQAVTTKITHTLRPGGTLLVLEPNARTARALLAHNPSPGITLSHRGIAKLFAETGLEILEVKPRFLPVFNKSYLTHMAVNSEWLQMIFGARYWVKARRVKSDIESTSDPENAIRQGETQVKHHILLVILLFLGLLVRLYHVTYPPNDHGTGFVWRQTQTLMMARQFYESRLNIFLPQVYWRTLDAAPVEGYVGCTELNVTPFLTALLYYVFGVQDWVGRIVPIFFSIVGLAYFHRLVNRFCGLAAALFGTTLLCFAPMYLWLGRVQMPESLTFCMIFMAVYYIDRWLEGDRYRFFPQAAACCAGMLLAKPQTAYMAIPIAYLVFNKDGFKTFFKTRYYLFVALVLLICVPFYIWSFYLLPKNTGIALMSGKIYKWGFHFLKEADFYIKMWTDSWSRGVGSAIIVLGLLGFVIPAKKRPLWFAQVFFAATFLSLFLYPGLHYFNPYYQTLFVPPLAMLGSQFLAFLGSHKIGKFLVVPVLVYSTFVSLQKAVTIFQIDDNFGGAYSACGNWIKEHTSTENRVIIPYENPSTLYFADRMGWICRAQYDGKPIVFSKELIGRLMPLGASIIAIPEILYFDAYTKQRDNAGKLRDYLYDSFRCYRENNFAVFFLKEPADLVIPPSGIIDCNEVSSFKYLRGNWGPYFVDRYGQGYIHKDIGSAKVKFVTREQVQRFDLLVSPEKDNGILTLSVNGKPFGEYSLPKAWKRYSVPITLDDPIERGTTVEIEMDIHHPPDKTSQRLLLWQVEAVSRP